MSAEQLIRIFSAAFYICIALTAAGFGFAAFAFFKYRIPAVFALMTGREKRKAMENPRESGRLPSGKEAGAKRQSGTRNTQLSAASAADWVTEDLRRKAKFVITEHQMIIHTDEVI